MKCAMTGREYSIFGYKGKQVRDNIHSLDVCRAFEAFYKNPSCGVLNSGTVAKMPFTENVPPYAEF